MPNTERAQLFAPLPPGPYQVIYSDPPWHYRGQVQHGGKDKGYTSGAEAFYPTVPIEDLCKLPVSEIADPDGAILFLWVTSPILEDGLRLMKAWGFRYKQVAFVWEKQRVNPGAYTMTSCEYVLVGTRKRIPSPRGARNIRQFLSEPRTVHSRKPDEIADRIRAMFPEQERIELFAREPRSGWTTYGNEIRNHVHEGWVQAPPPVEETEAAQ